MTTDSYQFLSNITNLVASLVSIFFSLAMTPDLSAAANKTEVEAQHAELGLRIAKASTNHTQHPEAQWFPDAGLGLFLHWDQGSVRMLGTSWPMIAAPNFKKVKYKTDPATWEPAEWARIIREKDFLLDGKKTITPNEYWALAKEFNPGDYHPEVWLQKAKHAGFVYAVLTTKHHNGFAMWPSAYGGFNTKDTPMKGRDLVKEYVNACRQVGLKVGLYFSGPDWHFDRDYKDFLAGELHKKYPDKLPAMNADHEPQTVKHTAEEIAAHQKAYGEMVAGQITELLSNYGKIDLIWFDGAPPIPNAADYMPIARIRELQPGIVINPRFHRGGGYDFVTLEKDLPVDFRLENDQWGELCSHWHSSWSWEGKPFEPFDEVVTTLARCRHAGINNLLDIGPLASGNLPPTAFPELEKMAAWMKINSEAIYGTRALPAGEKASVLASAKGKVRYLYLNTVWKSKRGKSEKSSEKDVKAAGPLMVSFTGLPGAYSAQLLGDEKQYTMTRNGTTQTVEIPAAALGHGVRVLKLAPKQ